MQVVAAMLAAPVEVVSFVDETPNVAASATPVASMITSAPAPIPRRGGERRG
ncbi:MAG: hypothetical protein ACRDOF_03380 [Gaiellaceae bacterium]